MQQSPNSSCATTSSTTTPTDPTDRSANAHPTLATSSPIGQASQSDDTPPATDSSTSTATHPEPPIQRPNREQEPQLRRARSPTRYRVADPNQHHHAAERVSGTHRSVPPMWLRPGSVGTLQVVLIRRDRSDRRPSPWRMRRRSPGRTWRRRHRLHRRRRWPAGPSSNRTRDRCDYRST